MLSFSRATTFLFLAALGLLFLSSCTKTEDFSLYDSNASYNPQPTITGITPAGGAVAGMDTVVVQGSNFSASVSENSVFFNASPAALLSSTSTQIMLRAPLVPSDSIGVRVAVSSSVQFSNTYLFSLKAGVKTWGSLQATETSTSIATDASGNLYSGISLTAVEGGIIKITPAGVRSTYTPPTSGVVSWTSLKMGPGGYLYAARNFRALYRFSPGGGSSGAVWQAFPVGVAINDIDFDQSGNVWGGGNNSNIYCVTQAKVITTTPFVGTVRCVRVYNGSLYFSAKTEAGEKIWRAQISGTTLGTPEVYFDFAATYPANIPLSITFSSDGIMYVGTDSQEGLLIVNASKTVSAPFGAYKAMFGTGLAYLTWGSSDDLYASTSNGLLVKFYVRGKKSAPYYGSTL
ncbi:MAG: IPT/TIG domain-containing protein [Ignavibacteriales bacterium]|nr:IPT/TIG domain-containing protein [Ignavibacteriales bacterium]